MIDEIFSTLANYYIGIISMNSDNETKKIGHPVFNEDQQLGIFYFIA